MKTVAVSALKGGVGKSTTALSLAYVIGNEFDKKVLLIDIDPQSSASILLGVTPNNYDKRTPFADIPAALAKLNDEDLTYEEDFLEEEDPDDDYENEININGIHTIFEAMMDDSLASGVLPRINKDLVDKCIHKPTYSVLETKIDENGKAVKGEDGKFVRDRNYYLFNFDVIPSTEYLSDIQLMWDERHMGKLNYINRGVQLKMLLKFIEENYNYDYCIIDCPPSLDLLSANAIAAADGVIIPASQDKQSLYSLKRIKRNVSQIKSHFEGHLGILGIVLTIFNEKRTVDRYIAKTVGHDLRLHVFNSKISETNDAKKATLSGYILPQINSRNYNETIGLFKEILERIEYLENRNK